MSIHPNTAAQMSQADIAAHPERYRLTLDADLTLSADGPPGAAAKVPTFSLVGYTGAAIRQSWSRNQIVVDLASMDTGNGVIPILYGHDSSLESILGQSDRVANDGRQLTLSGSMFGRSGTAEQVKDLARGGLKFQASIGADIGRMDNVSAGEKVVVNGREFTGPISVARNSRLREVSVVLMGADPATSAAIAAEAMKGSSMAHDANSQPTDKVEATAVGAVDKAPAPVVKAAGGDGASLTDGQAAILAALESIKADNASVREEIKAMKAVQAARTDRPSGPAIHVVEATAEPVVIEAALALQAGIGRPEQSYDDKTLTAANRLKRDIGLADVFVQAARANGYTGSSRINDSTLPQIIQAAFASHQIADLLSNLANKFLLNGFNSVESTYQRVSNFQSVKDFKAVNLLRLNGDLKFKKVGPAGELKAANVSDYKRSLAADTWGITTQITRQDLYNDDLNALSLVPQRMGRGAALAAAEAIWAEFIASNATYYQSITAAAGNALSITSLEAAAVAYRKLNDPDGNPLGVSPKVLLVPPSLEITAAKLMTSSLLLASSLGSTSSKNLEPAQNVLTGRYQVVVSNYLESLTGGSGSTWWLGADAADLPAMNLVYLNGQQSPTIEQVMPEADKLGVTLRGFFDFGVTKGEPLAMLRMATA